MTPQKINIMRTSVFSVLFAAQVALAALNEPCYGANGAAGTYLCYPQYLIQNINILQVCASPQPPAPPMAAPPSLVLVPAIPLTSNAAQSLAVVLALETVAGSVTVRAPP